MPENLHLKENKVTIKPVVLDDLDEIMVIEMDSFTLPWTRKSYEEMMEVENVRFKAAFVDGKPVGYMLFQFWPEGIELHAIATGKDVRRTGIGSALLKRLFAWSKENNINKLFLQVRTSNSNAIGLYEKFGFARISRKKHYYHDNNEDALIMAAKIVNGHQPFGGASNL